MNAEEAAPGSARAERTVTIVNRLGLHARAAARLVQLASTFQCEVRASRAGREVNAKSIMGVLLLAAAQGSQITLAAEGPDAGEAIDALCRLVAERFGEEA